MTLAIDLKLLLKTICPQNKRKVGIVWGSNPAHGVDWGKRRALKKSIPVQLLQQLSEVEKIQFVGVQNHENAYQASDAPNLDIIDMSAYLDTLASTAALMSQLDLIITVDTSIAHLGGALGLPTWVLLMQQSDWRWSKHTSESYWYASTRLFRQSRQGDWQSLLVELENELRRWSAEKEHIL